MTQQRAKHDCGGAVGVVEVLGRIGDRWSSSIIYTLGNGKLRFNALKRDLGISQRMLSLTLRELERDGLVLRHHFPTIPPKVEYELTPLGQSMRGSILVMAEWATTNQPVISAARAAFDAAGGRERLAAE